MNPLHVILTSIGTDGDIFPYVGLGAALRRRGNRVTLAVSEDYRQLAESNGLAFRPLVTREENEACFGDPDFWHPLKGPFVGARWGTAYLERQYELLGDLTADGPSVLVASPGIVSARLVQEKLARPMASVVLQPWMIRSSTAPPVMPAGLTLPRWAPRPVGALYWRGIDVVGWFLLGRALRSLRERLGLPPVRRVFSWWMSPQLMLGMFPDWYGQPQADWAPQIKLCGFPMYDGAPAGGAGGSPTLSNELEAFLAAGDPPVAFTFGTGMRHAAAVFRAAAEACRSLGARGLFLTKYAEQIPPNLPPTMRHVAYAPFQALFPRCAAVVHHGGIGTVAKAFAAGVPQLALPVAYDQTDNGTRLKRLGAGEWIMARRARPARMSEALRRVMTGDVRKQCRELVSHFGGIDAFERAADYVEELGASASTGSTRARLRSAHNLPKDTPSS